MADVLVLAEHHESEIRKVTFELITAARGLGSPVVLWLGSGLGDITSAALASFGATKILLADSADVIDHPVAPGAEIVASLIESLQPAAVLVASSADGKEIAARAAIKSGCGIITDAVEIATDGTATQSVFGGSTIVHSKVTHGTPIITIRPNSIAASESAATAVTEKISMGQDCNQIDALQLSHQDGNDRVPFVEPQIPDRRFGRAALRGRYRVSCAPA